MLASKFSLFRLNLSAPKKFLSSLPKKLPPPPLPQFNKHNEGIILDAVCLNLRRKQWSFLHQNSSSLTDPLIRKVILRLRNTPCLAVDFFNWAEKNKPPSSLSLQTHLTVVQVFASSRMFDEALSLLRHLVEHNGVPCVIESLCTMEATLEVCDALVRACTQLGSSKDAYLVIGSLRRRNFRVSIHAWNNLLNSALVSEGDGDGFWRLYREMLSYGYFENVNTFNLVVYALCGECRMLEAFSVLYRIMKKGFLPNVVTFNMLVDGCCRNGEVELGLKLFENIRAVSGMNVKPNCVTYNCLLNMLCKVGKAAVAERVVKEHMVDSGIEANVRTYATLIDGYAREGKLDEAFDLCNEMTDKGLPPNIVVFNLLMNRLLRKGRVDEAGSLLLEMKGRCLHPDLFTYSILVDGYGRNGSLQEAVGCYNQSRERALATDVVLCNGLMNHLCKNGKTKGAKQLLCNMIISGLCPDVITYSTLIHGFLMENRVDDAFCIHDVMVKEGQMPNAVTYNSIKQGLCNAKSVDTAKF